MFWILLSTGLVLFIHFILIKPFTRWSKRDIPQSSVWFFWKRILKGFVNGKTFAEQFQDLYNNYTNQRYVGIYQFHMPSLLLLDPELIKQITVKDFDHFVDHNQLIVEEPLWKKNLVALKGEQWREMRTTLSPSFTSSKMKMMFGLMCECAQQFVDHFLKKGEETITLEMKETFSRYTNDVIASVGFGIKCDSLKDPENEFYVKGRSAINFVGIKFILIAFFPRIANLFNLTIFSEEVSYFFRKVVKDTLEHREREGTVRLDMMHLLIQARKGKLKDEGSNVEFSAEEAERYSKLTDEDITAQALVFFLAGFESVASGMSFLAYELALNPDIQKQLQEEIDETINSQGSVTYDSLMKMKYLDMVLSESLRKWPITVVTDRLCVKPYTIEPTQPGEKPIHIKEGDLMAIPIYAMQRDPRFYPDPDRFNPERFSPENKSSINPYTYLTFGIGPRSCIGNRFAILEIKTLIFYVLSKFDIVTVDKTAIPLQIGNNVVNLTAKGGFWLGLKPRVSA
ncbi:hypothetical protein ILUMI_09067 [Ignelater luminosus]|uniref:Cytochrome P450 n=1 Tax=Ignelater luminosus TaxID=2038154 RepID=A0A8K0D4Z5_IGNLU|nr:hypothetical protein ILUMI_09067 [Ignelater luminosus]